MAELRPIYTAPTSTLQDITAETVALAKVVNQDSAYIARTIRLTLLAPDIIEAVMAGQCPPGLTQNWLSREFSVIWDDQLQE